ncbi:MAG TPA: C4-type zinc ribbon domain-containing protein [Actinomycetota bacterium]|nr:C4-type zinc ribbon domain-containing protein [Actinomycetota bacterium]
MTTPRLLALQAADTAIDRLRARARALEEGGEVALVRAEADAGEQRFGEIRLRLSELDRDQSRLEREIDSMTQKERDENARMYDGSIVNAKELEALQHEITSVRTRRSDREDELLALLELREQLESDATAAEAITTTLRAKAEAAVAAAGEERTSVETELSARIADRRSIESEIEPDVLELYEDLRRLKKGVGAAALIDGVCQACHEQLSAVELDKVKRATGIRRCEHCRRILVV